jgi:hypothetical protein
VISKTTARFRTALAALPPEIRQQARDAYKLFKQNPHHPSLRFRRVHPTEPIFSARVTLGYRAVGIREDDTIVWFWIGAHAEYERVLSRL